MRDANGKTMMTGDGVLASLRALCARVKGAEGEVPLRLVVPAYERLLQPREEADDYEAYVARGIHRVRSVLKKEPDLFDTASALDQCVEACLKEVSDGRGLAAVRLLLALAGGSDGATFVVRDPTRVTDRDAGARRRIGELLSSADPAQTVQSHHELLTRTSIPLESSRTFTSVDFTSLVPQSDRQATMWYPMSGVPHDTFSNEPSFSTLISSDSNVPKLIEAPDSTERVELNPQQLMPSVTRRGLLTATPANWDVLFFDGSQLIRRCDSECGSTEASSGDDEAQPQSLWSSFVSNVTIPSAWESIGKKQVVDFPQASAVSILLAQTATDDEEGIEIDEPDLIEHSVKALCGIESVLFRRDISAATLRLPRLKRVRSRTASSSSLMGTIEGLRRAGTAFLRLEYLSVYVTQDVNRGGSTARALGESLQLYLSSYQRRIHERLYSSPQHSKMALLKLLSQTRHLRNQIIDLAEALGCGEHEPHSFWDLLSSGKFPKGVALINRIHRALIAWEFQDADGSMTALLTWFLIRTASPFVSALGDFLSRGEVSLDIDPHNEFRSSFGSMDLSSNSASAATSDRNQDPPLPEFMMEALPAVQEIGHLESMLHSVVSEGHLLPPSVLQMPRRAHDAASSLAQTRKVLADMSDRVDDVCQNGAHFLSRRRSLKSPRSDESSDCQTGIKRIRREDEEFDPGVSEPIDGEQTENAAARGCDEVASDKLQNTGDDKCDDATRRYLHWRRDRAMRMSQAKQELLRIYSEEHPVALENTHGPADMDVDAPHDETPSISTSQIVQNHLESTRTDRTRAEDQQVHTQCPHPSDRTDDRGLLWRPRMRIQHATGGGGEDAYAALYPESSGALATNEQLKPLKSHKTSQASGGSGRAAFSSIYGRQPDLSPTEQKPATLSEDQKRCEENVSAESKRQSSPENDEIDVDMDENEVAEVTVTGQGEDDIAMDEILSASFDSGVPTPQPSEGLNRHTTDLPQLNSRPSDGYFPSAGMVLQLSTPFFTDNTSAEDTDLLESVQSNSSSKVKYPEFRSIVQLAILEPICLIHHYLNRSALKILVTKLKLTTHLSWMQRVMLMGEGLCMTSFASDIHTNMETEARVLLAFPGRLTTMLGLALIEARVVSSATSIPPFEYDVTNDFVRVASGASIPSISRIVSQLSLKYSHPSSLSSFITTQVEDSYLHAHRFLLSLRVTEQELKNAWLTWRKSSIRHLTQDVNTRRSCDLLLFTAHGFLSAFHEAFTCCILMDRWDQLLGGIERVESVVQLQNLLEQFASDARACCFQRSEQSEALVDVESLLDCVWEFGNILRQIRFEQASLDAAADQVCAITRRQASSLQELLRFLRRQEITGNESLRIFTKHLIDRLDTSTSSGIA